MIFIVRDYAIKGQNNLIVRCVHSGVDFLVIMPLYKSEKMLYNIHYAIKN